MTASLKALNNDSRFQSQNKWCKVDGMKSAGRSALRHPPSSNTRYSTKLYNVEGLDHNVHKGEWPTCKVKKTEEWMTQVSISFEQENKGEWWLNVGSIDSIYKTRTSMRHKRHRQRLHRYWKLNQSMEINSDKQVQLLKSKYKPNQWMWHIVLCSKVTWRDSSQR